MYYFSVLPSVVNNVSIVSIVSTVNIIIIVSFRFVNIVYEIKIKID